MCHYHIGGDPVNIRSDWSEGGVIRGQYQRAGGNRGAARSTSTSQGMEAGRQMSGPLLRGQKVSI